MFCFVGALALDLVHYSFSTALWSAVGRSKEKQGYEPEHEFKVPRYFNWPSLCFFWGKSGVCVIGYVKLLHFILQKL